MSGAPTFSIVTPSLNQARYLRATIESVLGQGYPGLEYFIQDGGSTDGTRDVLAGYSGRVPFVCEPDRGQAHAINRALRRATGEVLGYLNSDDVLLPGALRAVGEAFAADPNVVLVYGRARYIDEEGRPLEPYLTAPWDPRRLADWCFIAQPAAFWRRRVREEVGEFDEALHHTMDYDYWLRIAGRYSPGQVRYLDQELALARLHLNSKSISGWDRALEEIFELARRRTGYVSLWWCVAKWDHLLTGQHQAVSPHPVPWGAYPRALREFLARNPGRPASWWRGLKGAARGLGKRLGQLGQRR